MVARIEEKKHLSARGLFGHLRDAFKTVSRPEKGKGSRQPGISLVDCLMSGVAVFSLKYASLLQFDNQKDEELVRINLKNLYQVKKAPCDTYLRERLDSVDPKHLRGAFTKLFSVIQRGKELEAYEFIDKHYLLLSDGTGYFSSHSVHCKSCCEKKHRNGDTTYYHMMQGAVIAHPNLKEVIPLCPEPIMKADGATKNDCERNATERLLRNIRREHPHLPLILAEDALAANAPHLRLCQELNIRFITVVKPKGNKTLFDWLKGVKMQEVTIQGKKSIHKIRYYNKIPLNSAAPELEINFIEYTEYNHHGKRLYYNTWATDIKITDKNALDIAKGGRCRWSIENETFNTLKNQGYNFEHNFGHGKKQPDNSVCLSHDAGISSRSNPAKMLRNVPSSMEKTKKQKITLGKNKGSLFAITYEIRIMEGTCI